MPLGPGKYGANAAALIAQTDCDLCIIIMAGGPLGGSFDVATSNPLLIGKIPTLLRETATNIEQELGITKQ